MFEITWQDFYTGDWHTERIDGWKYAKRFIAELKQLGVRTVTVVGVED